MSGKSLTREQLLTMLAAAPPRIAAVTEGLASAQLHTAPAPGEWSATEVLAHMRSCADVWGNCIEVMLAQETPTIRAINPTTWIKQTNYREQAFHASLQAFTQQRTDLLAVLEPLTPEAWSREATVAGDARAATR